MRRFTGLFALGAALFALASAQAQQNYSQPVNFQTTNQSMWNPSLSIAGYSYDLLRSASWNYSGSASSYRHPFLLGRFGGAVTLDSSGSTGIDLNAYATAGSVDVNYPLTLTLTYPNPSTLSPGQTFTVSSSWSSPGGTMNTHSPDAGVKVNAFLNADTHLHAKVVAFSHNVINDDIINRSFNFNPTLFDTHTLTTGTHNIINDIISVSYHVPAVQTTGSGTTIIRSSGEDAFLTFNGDFSNAAANLLDLPPFSGGFSKGFRYANCFVNYSCLDLFGSANVSLAQNFQFSARPTVALSLSSGSPVSFQAGQSVRLTMPSDGSPLTITPSVSLDNQFTNNTHVKVGGLVEFVVLDATAGAHVSGLFTKEVHYAPLFPFFLLNPSALLDVPVYNQSFRLGGFASQTLPAFTLGHVDTTPLSAQDDSYVATSTDGVHYNLTVSAPGLLANDTGPTGFHALDFVGQTADGLFAITINTDGSFNFQGTKGAAGEYIIPYSITDGHGHFATANIVVTFGAG